MNGSEEYRRLVEELSKIGIHRAARFGKVALVRRTPLRERWDEIGVAAPTESGNILASRLIEAHLDVERDIGHGLLLKPFHIPDGTVTLDGFASIPQTSSWDV